MKVTNQHTNPKFKVQRYTSANEKEWNDFVATSKNATFLFRRNFMDYHQDRFEDYSLMVYKSEKLIALLPANKVENELHSHQGLTYGGLLLNQVVKFPVVLNSFQVVLQFLREENIQKLHLKLLPKIYHKLPSDEMNYMLFILDGTLTKKETLSVIEQGRKFKIGANRLEGVIRGQKHQLIIKEESTFDEFWNSILSVNLDQKFSTTPVHSLQEIETLKLKFPKNIRQFNVYHNTKLVAGTTIFESENVAHCQYISANADKNFLGSLDFLHHHLITTVFKDKLYYDFGSSNEDNGRKINQGLHFWKEGFGARTVVQELYSIKTENSKLLNDVLK